MKKFLIKVNGAQYEVEVEEVRDGVTAPSSAVTINTPASAPVPKAVAPPKTAASSAGSVKVNAPMPGTILAVNVSAGDVVKKGQVLVVLEAMKMENEILSPQDGTIDSVEVSKGAAVESGNLLLTLT